MTEEPRALYVDPGRVVFAWESSSVSFKQWHSHHCKGSAARVEDALALSETSGAPNLLIDLIVE